MENKTISHPQCQYFVVRKKRLCRMTVRPGRSYCGEHEPQPRCEKGKNDTRIPCPYDPKHTCYASKLMKHLAICNARQQEEPEYIVQNINAPADHHTPPRKLLSQIPQQKILALIEKVNILYDKYVRDNIITIAEKPIHRAVIKDFEEKGRTESSLRHLKQASSLLHLMEAEGLVQDNTCYVELGAGKGQLSFYAYTAWCGDNSSQVVLVDRASLRHKRDNKLREPRLVKKENSNHIGSALETSIDSESTNIITNDSRDCSTVNVSEDKSKENTATDDDTMDNDVQSNGPSGCCRIRADLRHLALEKLPEVAQCQAVVGFAKHLCGEATDYALRCITSSGVLSKVRGVVLATCCHHRCESDTFAATEHLLEMGIDAEDLNIMLGMVSWATCGDGRSRERRNLDRAAHGERPGGCDNSAKRTKVANDGPTLSQMEESGHGKMNDQEVDKVAEELSKDDDKADVTDGGGGSSERKCEIGASITNSNGVGGGAEGGEGGEGECGPRGLRLRAEERAAAGRRAKALLDAARARLLRARGLRARLARFVPPQVSPENLAILATRASSATH